ERKPAAHRVAGNVAALDAEVVPQGDEVVGARVHRAEDAVAGLRFPVAPEVGHDPSPAFGHSRDELAPAAAALRETVQKGDRRAVAGDKVAQPGVLTLQNHDSILCPM